MDFDWSNKVVLVTGGTGSFGRKFTQLMLRQYNPEAIRIYSRDEAKQYHMEAEFHDERLRFLIGDVRDRQRLSRAMNGVDVVVHAAALKQVPAAEYNPLEAVKTNIDGAANVIDCAIDNGVPRVITISSDKAVHPVNLYGATKLVAEKLMVAGNSYTGPRQTRFSCVRYGNVVGSTGSVIPVFYRQRNNGVITITDERMTRFWITLEQGAQFVADCVSRMLGGEVFIPRIPSMRLVDLADVVAPSAKRVTVGIRPGEKLHEVLLTEDESRHAREFSDYYVVEPEHPFWHPEKLEGGKPVPDGFRYTSDTNDCWLTADDLKAMVQEFDPTNGVAVE